MSEYTLGNCVRDLTAAHPLTKSEARRIVKGLLDAQPQRRKYEGVSAWLRDGQRCGFTDYFAGLTPEEQVKWLNGAAKTVTLGTNADGWPVGEVRGSLPFEKSKTI